MWFFKGGYEMAIYHFNGVSLEAIKDTSFSDEGILERSHLQTAFKQNISVIAPDCMVIAEEFSEWSEGNRRIDLLAVDRDANLVVIELKRNDNGDHMELQAIRYASMVRTLTFKRAVEIFQKYLTKEGRTEDATNLLYNFISADNPEEIFATDTRIILVSAGFSKEITTSVIWLNLQGLDITCVEFIPHNFEDKILIDARQVIPLPQAESLQVSVRKQSEERKAASENSRDHSKFVFKGVTYNKRKLVLAVVQDWLIANKPVTYDKLTEAFPNNIRSGGLFHSLDEAKETYERHGIERHFLKDDEIIPLSDHPPVALSNQWGAGNHTNFVDHALAMDFEITKV